MKYMLFSATFPKRLRDIAKEYLADDHIHLRVGRAGSSHGNIQQVITEVDHSQKRKALVDLLNSLPPGRTIIFVNRKQTADELDDFLYNLGLPCTSIHASRTQMEREDAMRAFRGGECPILISTGVAARGIDVHNVNHVVNYDLPSIDHGGIEEYVHRIGELKLCANHFEGFTQSCTNHLSLLGRTGRIGHRGLATSFYTDRDEPIASVLTRTLLETDQTIPEFLQHHIPDGDAKENLKFEADSDFEEYGEDGGDGAWGGNGEDGNGDGDGGAWGAPADSAADSAADSWGEKKDTPEGDAWGSNDAQNNAGAVASW